MRNLVDFVNWIECLYIDEERDFNYDFHVETDNNTSVMEIFKDYASCKKFVDEKNIELATRIGTTSASKISTLYPFKSKK